MLRAVVDRVGLNDLRLAAASITQSERLGASLARVLRVQSQDLRAHRRMAAQERAMQIPIRILFPLVRFIFPALFVVLQLLTTFGQHAGG